MSHINTDTYLSIKLVVVVVINLMD